MFLPISVSVVFLSAAYPEEGGLCSWTQRAFGPFAGFVTGWTYWSGTPAFAIWTQAIVVALLVILGQSGTYVRGAYNVLIEMMIVSSLAPFLFLFGATIRLSAGEGVVRKARIPGGRLTIVVIALIGIATTIASMVISFVPPPDEDHPTLAVIKIGGLTAVLLLGGAALCAAGSLRARRQVALAR
jgi:glutamate:GABA antiporter